MAKQIVSSKGIKATSLIGIPERNFLVKHASKAKVVIEIGCWQGATTKIIADALPEDGVVYAIDPWNKEHTRRAFLTFMNLLENEIKSGKVKVYRLLSKRAFEVLSHLKADLVFIDGDHRYDAVLKDIKNYSQLVRSGGIICGDDYEEEKYVGLRRAVKESFGDNYQVIRHLWWTVVRHDRL